MPDISPAKRSRIIREIHANPQRLWTGSVSGRRVRIAVIPTIPVLPPYESSAAAVLWRVCIARRWRGGTADTVWGSVERGAAMPIKRGNFCYEC